MNSDNARHVPDRPFRMAQPSLPTPLLYLCGTASKPHKGIRAGGFFRGGLPMRCPNCNVKGKA